MIKENLEKQCLTSGTGRRYSFDRKIYLNATKFIMKKFDMKFEQAKSILNYFLVSKNCWKNNKLVNIYKSDKKTTNARLKNIVELNYNWNEFFK